MGQTRQSRAGGPALEDSLVPPYCFVTLRSFPINNGGLSTVIAEDSHVNVLWRNILDIAESAPLRKHGSTRLQAIADAFAVVIDVSLTREDWEALYQYLSLMAVNVNQLVLREPNGETVAENTKRVLQEIGFSLKKTPKKTTKKARGKSETLSSFCEQFSSAVAEEDIEKAAHVLQSYFVPPSKITQSIRKQPIEEPGKQPWTDKWTNEKNERRCKLIEKEIYGVLTPQEQAELETLQEQMLEHRRRMAPLPLADAKQLYQELLQKKK